MDENKVTLAVGYTADWKTRMKHILSEDENMDKPTLCGKELGFHYNVATISSGEDDAPKYFNSEELLKVYPLCKICYKSWLKKKPNS